MKPWLKIKDLSELTLSFLNDNGIEGLIIDVDNTLTLHHQRDIHRSVQSTFEQLAAAKPVVIFSNCQSARHTELGEIFTQPVVPYGFRKPARQGFEKALQMLNLPPEKTAMVGDRALTDILGANLMGIRSILVHPFDGKEPVAITFLRKLEHLRLGYFR